MSLKALARDLSCQPATVNANRTLVYPCLTMIVRQALTKKIYPVLTINVPLFVRVQDRIGYKGGMNEILFMIGTMPVHTGEALIGFGALALILLVVIAVVIARSGRRGLELAQAQALRADELEERLGEVLRAQSEATGRVDAMGQALAGRQAEMARAVTERLDFGDPSRRPIHGTDHAKHHGFAPCAA